MGFTTIIDIVGSIILGGIILTMMTRMTNNASDYTFNYGAELSNQRNMVSSVMILENDIKKIGYCARYDTLIDQNSSILLADSSRIKFLYDMDKNNVMDTVYYYLGPISDLTSTPNPKDRYIYRKVNSQPVAKAANGVIIFKFVYFDVDGDTIPTPVTSPGEISILEMNLRIEPPSIVEQKDVYNKGYMPAFLRQTRLKARNLRER